MGTPSELTEARAIADELGLRTDDLYGYPPSFEAYLITMRVRGHLSALKREIAEHEAAMVINAALAAA